MSPHGDNCQGERKKKGSSEKPGPNHLPRTLATKEIVTENLPRDGPLKGLGNNDRVWQRVGLDMKSAGKSV